MGAEFHFKERPLVESKAGRSRPGSSETCKEAEEEEPDLK